MKKTLIRSEKNISLLQKVLESYSRSHLKQHKRTLQLASVLAVLAKNEPILKPHLESFGALLNERERSRNEMTGRMQVLSIEPLKHYKSLCAHVMQDVKDHGVAIDIERKKRTMAENAALKNNGDYEAKARIVLSINNRVKHSWNCLHRVTLLLVAMKLYTTLQLDSNLSVDQRLKRVLGR